MNRVSTWSCMIKTVESGLTQYFSTDFRLCLVFFCLSWLVVWLFELEGFFFSYPIFQSTFRHIFENSLHSEIKPVSTSSSFYLCVLLHKYWKTLDYPIRKILLKNTSSDWIKSSDEKKDNFRVVKLIRSVFKHNLHTKLQTNWYKWECLKYKW